MARNWVALLWTVVLSACGSGTAAIASGGGGGGGGAGDINSEPSLIDLGVDQGSAEVSPAAIEFRLIDPEGDTVEARMEFEELAGSGLESMTLVGDPDLSALATSKDGIVHSFEWDFEADLGTTELTEHVRVLVTVVGGQGSVTPGAVGAEGFLDFGNDPARIGMTRQPLAEASGIVRLTFETVDTSSHSVAVRAEYALDALGPPVFRLATRAGFPGTATADGACTASSNPEVDCVSLFGLEADSAGVQHEFFWDSERDLGSTELDVLFRFVPDDGFTPSGALQAGSTVAFRIDNNDEPIAIVQGADFALNPDRRLGIPVPIEVVDLESDVVDVIVQWKRSGASFPSLTDTSEPNGTPLDRDEVLALLGDDRARRRYQIATEFAPITSGRFGFGSLGTSVELSGLADLGAALRAADVPGRTLALLRRKPAAGKPLDLVAVAGISQPVAVLPLGEGTQALVLDSPAGGTWRLSQVDLATGALVRQIATANTGVPRAMAFEPGGASVLVASGGGNWTVQRVRLADGTTTKLVTSASGPPGPPRGIAAFGEVSSLLTIGNAVVRLAYPDPSALGSASVIVHLVEPRGISRDPVDLDRALVADFGADQLVAIDANTGDVVEFATLADPDGVAFAPDGARVFANADLTPGASRDLVAIELAGPAAGFTRGIATLTASSFGVAAGREDRILVAGGSSGTIGVGGGIAETRRIAGFDPATSTAKLDAPFAEAALVGREWQIRSTFAPFSGTPEGRVRSFVWDSRDVPSGGLVSLRAVPFDAERGIESESGASRPVDSLYAAPAYGVGEPDPSSFIAGADFDGDGATDVAMLRGPVNGDEIAIFAHADLASPDPFGAVQPSLTFAVPGTMAVRDFQAADLDGDARIDLVLARSSEPTLAFLQGQNGDFATTPVVVAQNVRFVRPADFDLDGVLDFAATASGPTNVQLAVRRQQLGTTITFATELLGSLEPDDAAVVDFDLDGRPDVAAIAVSSGALFAPDVLDVHLQTSAGDFPASPDITRPLLVDFVGTDVATGDLDGDGLVDIAAVQFPGTPLVSSTAVTVFRGDAPGSIETSPSSIVSDPRIGGGMEITDLDGDGLSELVMRAREPSTLAPGVGILFHDRIGTFTAESFALILGPIGSRVVPIDVDGDGGRDFVFASSLGSNALGVLRQARSGFVDPARRLVLAEGQPFVFAGEVDVADVDGDGLTDVVATHIAGAQVAAVLQKSPGLFSPLPVVVATPPSVESASSLALADFDRDGRVDAAVGNQSSSSPALGARIAVFLQGGGGFSGVPDQQLGGQPKTLLSTELIAADFDGNGFCDLASGQQGSAQTQTPGILVFFGAVGGFPTSPGLGLAAALMNTPGVRRLIPSDIDDDGDLDLVAGLDQAAAIFRNAGTGALGIQTTFPAAPHQIVGSSFTGGEIAVADMDGDGRLDIVLGGAPPQLHRQASTNVFAQASFDVVSPSGQGVGPSHMIPVDWDRDGDRDLVLYGGFASVVLARRPDDKFQLEPLADMAGTISPNSGKFSVVDVDADGDLDLVGFEGTAKLTVFFGGR